MPLVTTRDGLDGFSRLGAGDCPVLNIAPLVNRWVTGNPCDRPIDICIFDGMAHACHTESSGPYVQAWDGASWNLLGSAMEASGALNPVIATDGTDLFVAYFWLSTNYHLRIRHWTGGSWALVADVNLFGIAPPVGPGTFNTAELRASLTVAGGKAYAAFGMLDTFSATGFSFLRDVPYVVRSDGTHGVVPSSLNATGYDGYGAVNGRYVLAVTTSAGAPIGIYTKSVWGVGSLVFFDLDTLADLYEAPTPPGPSPLVPGGANIGEGRVDLMSDAFSGYGSSHNQILFSTAPHAYLTIPEDFSSSPVVLDGTGELQFNSDGIFAVDPGDPENRQFWYFGGGGFYDFSVDAWQPACSGARINYSAVNTPPYYPYYSGYGIPIPSDCTYANPFFQQAWGSPRIACDGTYLYVFWVWWPALTDAGDGDSPPNDFQFIVERSPIVRGGAGCSPSALHPVFSTRGKEGA